MRFSALRGAALAVLALLFTAGGVLGAAAPASAHSIGQVVVSAEGCDWPNGNYSVLHSGPIETNDGDRFGTAYLLWNAQYQQNCAVALKTGSLHGVVSWTAASLQIEGRPSAIDMDYYAHYAAASAEAADRCVRYQALIETPNLDRTAYGGRNTWGNCG
ncbi:hypothetical protein [Allonocardiopsis opalescens]|uniref:Secreted protein n=1 Tax=Allonocardiopsis opalescens TaxID=1144618 RepID=A0A2T0PTX4_9ACTN|nr:hypothetical protein [Allonocardiopsis opalescens]PRX92355.1 hypothetical protein CLV72_110115 [Allonocardiopsis opalescens]